ncbi:MAG: hypothetical protein WC821_01200 [archaeon]|jgi:hypothetical protein
MTEKDSQLGIVVLIAAAFFLMSGLEMLDFQLFDAKVCTLLAFALVAIGVYLITKK